MRSQQLPANKPNKMPTKGENLWEIELISVGTFSHFSHKA
jgi:hypothetical protein